MGRTCQKPDKIFHFVRHQEVADFERVAWRRHGSLDGTHHGCWSSLMEWKCEGSLSSQLRLPPKADVPSTSAFDPHSDVGALSPVVLSASIAFGGGYGLTARLALLAIADEVIE
jgi:hypothetical protein